MANHDGQGACDQRKRSPATPMATQPADDRSPAARVLDGYQVIAKLLVARTVVGHEDDMPTDPAAQIPATAWFQIDGERNRQHEPSR